MRSALLLPIIVGVAVVVGGLLYLFGGEAFQQSSVPTDGNGVAVQPPPAPGKGTKDFTVLAKGQNAGTIDQRVNYRITDPDQFAALWQMIYTANGPSVPVVDFDHQEVVALFDGSHSTGGYAISLTGLRDENGRRIISILHTEPGDRCITTTAATSPFMLVLVPKSDLAFDHEETTQVTQCP